ncbi:MAG: ZIP family metal transporter, partial [Parcubacteria group bacterium]
FNYLSASLAFLGAVVVLTIGGQLEILKQLLVPFTVGGFIYIAAADLLPELKEEVRLGRSVVQLLIFTFGIAVMALMLLLE